MTGVLLAWGDFRDRHLQHHLVAPAHGDAVDHGLGAADELGGDLEGLLRFGRAGGGAGEHHGLFADALDADVGVGHRLLERGAHAVQVARHGDIEAGDLATLRVEEEDVGLPDLDADHVDAARRAHDGIGDGRVGDQHVLDVGRQVDGDRLADAERDEARCRLARRHLDDRDMRVGGHRGGRNEAGRGEERRERDGADQGAGRHVCLIPSHVTGRNCCRRRSGRR